MKMKRRVRGRAAVATMMLTALLSPIPPPVSAARTPKPLAGVEVAPDLLTFQPRLSYSHVRVTVTGPGDFQVVETFSSDETPTVALPGTDGLYKYELRFSPVLDREARDLLAQAREDGIDLVADKAADKHTVQRGWFSLADGSVVPDLVEPKPKVVLTTADGVIRNSQCVGFDCPNSPVFDDSTILMMENNTRIKFGDTSAAPFPNNDWEIEANSSLSGGANYLGFNDCGAADNDGGCATDLVFAVESGVRQSALYVEDDGDIGIGTSNPVLDLHIVTGNTPALRLDQDGTSGFTPQVWDIAGNETNFFVRDVTGGSTLPLRIRPGARTSSIDVASSGDVGLGTSAPAHDLHVQRGNEAVTLGLTSTQTNQGWVLNYRADTAGQNFLFNYTGVAGNEFTFTTNGNLTITGSLVTGGAGLCNPGPCDGVFSPEYQVESIEEHGAYMWENRHLWGVGPTPEGAPINISQKTTGILHELEKAHIFIEQLNDRLKAKEAQLAELQQRLAMIEEHLGVSDSE